MHYFTLKKREVSLFDKLLEIPDCPDGLYVRGESFDYADYRFITIVGSRTPSKYAQDVLKSLISDLSGYKICIVSGLALGIDTIAHRTALKQGLPTIAFPGSGLDDSVLYPATNRALAKSILDSQGLLVSEYKPDTKAARWTFPQRNRLMAGVSDLVLVVEAQEKSGTLITARLGMEYNRDVAVIPGDIDRPHNTGSNKLMKDGAHPILGVDEILELLGLEKQASLFPEISLSKDEKELLELIKEPLSKQELYDADLFSYTKTTSLLCSLEIRGVIKEVYGKYQLC